MKGHIRERSPGRWAIVLDLRDPETGKRRRKWHAFRGTKRQAQEECARLIAELRGGVYIEPDRTPVARFIERWLEHVKPTVSAKTYERYAELAQAAAVLIGDVTLSKLKTERIDRAWSKALLQGRKNGTGGLSPRTVHHMRRVLIKALNQAATWELIQRNPATVSEAPRVERKRMGAYDAAQSAELLSAFRQTRMYIPVLLATMCGLRRGEICALRWRNVELGDNMRQLSIVESAEQTKGGIYYKAPKSGRSRTVALSKMVREELRAHRARQAEEQLRLGIRPDVDSFVVAQHDGQPLQPRSLTHEWTRILRGTPLPRIRFHDLRHSHATQMLAAGVHPKVASERLGHSTIAITLDLYSHVMPGMQADAAERVDEAIQRAVKAAGEPNG